MSAKTNWTRDGWNRLTNCSVYMNGRGEWYARNEVTKAVSGPFALRREARLASYDLLEKTRCPECGGFGYHEDGTRDGRECETCGGDGVVVVSS